MSSNGSLPGSPVPQMMEEDSYSDIFHKNNSEVNLGQLSLTAFLDQHFLLCTLDSRQESGL